MKNKFILFVVFAAFASIQACSRDVTVATVDGKKITASALRAEMRMERGKYDSAILNQKANFEKFREGALNKLINEQVLLTEAQKKGIKLTDEDLKEIEQMRTDALAADGGENAITERGVNPKAWVKAQQTRIVIQRMIQQELLNRIPVSDGQITAYYNKHAEDFNQPAQFRARQILVDSKDTAEEVYAKLKDGGDFAEMAKEYSLSPDGKRGGDLGFFSSRNYPEIFSTVCQQLKIGELSDVVQTDYGFQIFELLDKRPAYQVPFEEAKESIKQLLREERAEDTINKWSADLIGKAAVSINEETLKGVALD